MKQHLARALFALLEPFIQAAITARIVKFHEGLVRDGVIRWVQPGTVFAAPQSEPMRHRCVGRGDVRRGEP